jgi:protein tyrosine kinase modulator
MSAAEPEWDGVEGESGGGLPEFLLDPVGVARRRWLPAALCFVVGLVTTVVLTLVWKPSYLAQATILITSQQIPREFVTSTVQEDSLANVNAMIGEVLSAENLSKLIDDLKLFQDESADTARIDLVTKMRSRIGAAPESTPSPRSRNTEAIVYGISYESDQGQEAARVANALAALFVEASISRRNTQARLTTQFLRKALENDEKELREITRQISEFRQENRGLLPEEQQTLLRKLELLSSQRDSLSQQIAAKQDRIVSISSQGGDAVLSENEILLGELRRELARQSAILTDEHPNVIALRDRIARLQAETTTSSGLPASTAHVIEDERREIARLREQLSNVEGEIADLDSRANRAPVVAEQLAARERKEVVLREDYLDALRKVQEAELAENLESAQQGGQVSILDPASPPTKPKVARVLIAAAGLVGSVGLTVCVALLLELLDPVMLGSGMIERESGKPVLGSVPLVAG